MYQVIIKAFSDLTKEELYAILKLRQTVFVLEQQCFYQDLDDLDQKAYHVFFQDGEEVIAYLRVIKAGIVHQNVCIGRVISQRRRQGIGTALLQTGIQVAQEKYAAKQIDIEAQEYAVPFYERAGFEVKSEPFLMDGIWHVNMSLCLEHNHE